MASSKTVSDSFGSKSGIGLLSPCGSRVHSRAASVLSFLALEYEYEAFPSHQKNDHEVILPKPHQGFVDRSCMISIASIWMGMGMGVRLM